MATWNGIYTGTVVSASDPLGAMRVQLLVPQVLGAAVSAWALPANGTPSSAPGAGTSVKVMFDGGEPAKPVYFWSVSGGGGGGGVSYPISVADGGTGQTTAAAALTALGGVASTALGSAAFQATSAFDAAGAAATAQSNAETFASNTFVPLSDLPLSIANGGTGQTTASAALTALGGLASGAAAGGDLSGTLPNPTVAKIKGITLPAAAPAAGNVLTATSATATAWSTPAAGVTLDTTSTDIQALGTQAAGASGLAADAKHVHPTTGLVTSVNGSSGAVSVTPASIGALSTSGTAPQANSLATSVVLASSSTQSGDWQQFATISLASQFQDGHVTLMVQGVAGGADAAARSFVTFRVKQQAAMGSAPFIELYSDLNEAVTPSNFMAITTVNSASATTVEFWFLAPQDFETYGFYVLGNSFDGDTVTFAASGTWIAAGSLPAGTQQLGVYGPGGPPTVPIASGGTGQTTASAALTALGGAALAGATFTGPVVIGSTLNIPSSSGAHFGVDASGNVYLVNSSAVSVELLTNHGGILRYTAGLDGNTYDTGRLTKITESTQTLNSTTATPLTGLSGVTVAAGTYRITGQVYWTQTTADTSQGLQFQGSKVTTGTRVLFKGWPLSGNAQSTQFLFQLTSNSSGGFGGTVASGGPYLIEFEGTIVFSAADTFGLEGTANSATNTWVAQNGSWFDLMPVV